MTVYNNEPFLEKAIESIQKQTVTNWELIIIDDCSTDNSPTIIKTTAEQDHRIKTFQSATNQGAGAARDQAIKHAQGQFIAIMDGDDIAHVKRLEIQLTYLREYPDVVAVGCQTKLIDQYDQPYGTKTFPTAPPDLYKMMYTAIPIQLPTLMVNRQKLPDNFDWFEGWRYSEDTLLFFKLAYYGQIANSPDFLLQYRYYNQSTSYQKAKTYFFKTYEARKIARQKYGYHPTTRARLVSTLQFIVVSCLPEKLIPAIYKSIRCLMLKLSGHHEF